jgi:very-short-patch-repair endonuclease
MLPFNKKLKPFARNLRHNLTDAEQLIWSKIRKKQIGDFQFYRQKNIGDYILDFYCPTGKLIVEIDGGQHYEDDGMMKDQTRDKYLQMLGFAVLRFFDIDVLKNIDGVVERIYEHLKSPLPPFKKGGNCKINF